MSKESNIFIFKANTNNLKIVKISCWNKLNEHIGNLDKGEFQVEFKPLSNALDTYFMLVGAVVKWHRQHCKKNGDVPYSLSVWREYFQRKAGLIEEIDLMSIWKITYKDMIKNGWVFHLEPETRQYSLRHRDYGQRGEYRSMESIGLGDVFRICTLSLANKGDITKSEMELLINTVLEFGAENNIPNCYIRDGELERLLKFKGWKDE